MSSTRSAPALSMAGLAGVGLGVTLLAAAGTSSASTPQQTVMSSQSREAQVTYWSAAADHAQARTTSASTATDSPNFVATAHDILTHGGAPAALVLAAGAAVLIDGRSSERPERRN